jgi:AcrR family transcriptional regulator
MPPSANQPAPRGQSTPKPRQRALQQRTIDTRTRIVDAAIEQFADVGYDGVSTRAVARTAGVQHALVTYHFGSKEGLWKAAIDTLLSDYRVKFDERIHGLRGVDDVIKLRLVQEDFIRFSAESPNFHRIMGHIARTPSAHLTAFIQDSLKETFDVRAQLIRSAQASGKYVAGDPYHLQYLFIGAVTRIFMLGVEFEQISGRSVSDPAFIEDHVKLCLSLFFRD